MFNLFETPMEEATYSNSFKIDITEQQSSIFCMDIEKDKYTYMVDHHLEHQDRLIGYPNPTHLRFRQILAHQYIRAVPGSVSHSHYLTGLMGTGLEVIFKRFLQEALQTQDQEQSQSDLSLKFMFECYSLKESIQIGLFKSGDFHKKQIKLSGILSLADNVINQVIHRHWLLEHRLSMSSRQPKLSIPFKHSRKDFNFKQDYPAFLEKPPAGKDALLCEVRVLIERSLSLQKEHRSQIANIFEDVEESKVSIRKVGDKYDIIDVFRTLSIWIQKIINRNQKIIQSPAFTNFLRVKHRIYDKFHLHSYLQENSWTVGAQYGEDQILSNLIGALVDVLAAEMYLKNKEDSSHQREYMVTGVLRTIVRSDLALAFDIIKKSGFKVIEVVDRPDRIIRTVSVYYLLRQGIPAELIIYQPSTSSSKLLKINRILENIQSNLLGPMVQFIIKCIKRSGKEYVCSLEPSGKVQTKETYLSGNISPATNLMKCPVGHHPFVKIKPSDLGQPQEICRHCCLPLNELRPFFYCFRCSSSYCTPCSAVSEVSKIVETLPRALRELVAVDQLNTDTDKIVFFHLEYSPASILMQAFLESWNKNDSQSELYQVNVSDKTDQTIEDLLKRLKILRFPCFTLFKGSTPIKQITGASVYQLCEVLRMLGSKDELTMPVRKCLNNHALQLRTNNPWTQWFCTECKKHSKPNSQFLYCGRCPYFVCLDCSLISSAKKVNFQDTLGTSYLSTPRNCPQEDKECNCGQKMTLLRKIPNFSPQYKCSQCHKYFYFNGEYGMWLCYQCQRKVCHRCSELLWVEPERNEYVSHHIVRTASNLSPCKMCKEFMKWTYSNHSNNQSQEEWECNDCSEKFPYDRLHLVCLRCSVRICSKQSCRRNYLRQHSPELHKNMCKDCSGDKPGELIKRLGSYDQYFECRICKFRHYSNTIHYQCLSCKNARYCRDCKDKMTKERLKKLKLICMSEANGVMNLDQFQAEFDVDMTIHKLRKQIDPNQRCSVRILNRDILERFDQDNKKVGDLDNDVCVCFFKSKRIQSYLPNNILFNIANSKIVRRRSTIKSYLSARSAAQKQKSITSSNPETAYTSSLCSLPENPNSSESQAASRITTKSAPVSIEQQPYKLEGSIMTRHKRMSISLTQEKLENPIRKCERNILQEKAQSQVSEKLLACSLASQGVGIELDSLKQTSIKGDLPSEDRLFFEQSTVTSSPQHPNLVAHIRHAESMYPKLQPKPQ